MHLHDETWNHHRHISNGAWRASSPLQPRAWARLHPPRTKIHSPTDDTESDCWFYGALQQLQMLLHVRWSKRDEYLSHQQAGALSYHLCAAVLHKGMGALWWHNCTFPLFPLYFFCFVLSFEREVCVGKVFIHEHPLWQYSKRKQRKFGALHEMFSGKKKLTDACRFGISSSPVAGEKDVSPAFRRIWSVCSSPFLCEKCLCETWCQFIILPVLDSSCCMVSFGCITRTLMLRSPCAQQVKSSKLAWPGWWGSMLPGYVDGVRRFSQGAWEGGRRERRRERKTEGRCDQPERKRWVGGEINAQRGGGSSQPGEKMHLWTFNKF